MFDRFPEPCQTEIPRASGSAGAAPALRASAYRPRGAAGPWNLCLARLWESINPLDFSQKAGLQGEFRACKATSSAQPEDFLIYTRAGTLENIRIDIHNDVQKTFQCFPNDCPWFFNDCVLRPSTYTCTYTYTYTYTPASPSLVASWG